jgi:hypothetical protein
VLGVDAAGGLKFDAADLDALLAPLAALTADPSAPTGALQAARRWGRTGDRGGQA